MHMGDKHSTLDDVPSYESGDVLDTLNEEIRMNVQQVENESDRKSESGDDANEDMNEEEESGSERESQSDSDSESGEESDKMEMDQNEEALTAKTVAVKLQSLKEIEERVNILSLKLSHGEEVRTKLKLKVIGPSEALEFNALAAAKHRTQMGTIVEDLMKILCELDQIQSEGSDEVLKLRRKLVRAINAEHLPKADSEFAAAEKLVAVVRSRIASRKPVDLNQSDTMLSKQTSGTDTNAVENEATEPIDTETKMQNEPVQSDIIKSKPQLAPETDAVDGSDESMPEKVRKPLTKSAEEESRELKRTRNTTEQVRYQVREDDSTYFVKVQLPKGERMKDLQFEVKSESVLLLKGKHFQLPIEVDPRKACLDEARWRVLSETFLLISFPKLRRMQYARPRQSFYSTYGRPQQQSRLPIWSI